MYIRERMMRYAYSNVVIKGQGWTGDTTCDAGSTCVKLNDWYSRRAPSLQVRRQTRRRGPRRLRPTPVRQRRLGSTRRSRPRVRSPSAPAPTRSASTTRPAPLTICEFGQFTPENSMKSDATERKHIFGPLHAGLVSQLRTALSVRKRRCAVQYADPRAHPR